MLYLHPSRAVKTPLRNLVTRGRFPNVSAGLRTVDKTERAMLMLMFFFFIYFVFLIATTQENTMFTIQLRTIHWLDYSQHRFYLHDIALVIKSI